MDFNKLSSVPTFRFLPYMQVTFVTDGFNTNLNTYTFKKEKKLARISYWLLDLLGIYCAEILRPSACCVYLFNLISQPRIDENLVAATHLHNVTPWKLNFKNYRWLDLGVKVQVILVLNFVAL